MDQISSKPVINKRGSDGSESILYDMLQHCMGNLTVAIETSLAKLKPMLSIKPLVASAENNYTILTPYNYTYIFGFENDFESRDYAIGKRDWMARNWKWSFVISAIYIILIVIGRLIMQSRQKYELRPFLIVWNLMLAVFSIFGALRSWPEFYHSIFERDIVYSICENNYAFGITGFWAYMFIMSKLPELIDTLFIVLRKQQLIFLHYYHHATVLIYCWFSYHDFSASGLWFMNMNYLVHSLMYSYYALKAMRIRIPTYVSWFITTGQIVQMIFGCYVNYVAWQTKKSGKPCQITYENIAYSSLMYLSYFVLFFNFFLNSYIFGAKKQSKQSTDISMKKNRQDTSSHSASLAKSMKDKKDC